MEKINKEEKSTQRVPTSANSRPLQTCGKMACVGLFIVSCTVCGQFGISLDSGCKHVVIAVWPS